LNAFAGRNEELSVLCFPNDIQGLAVPSNVHVMNDVFGDEFLERMKASLAVIVPLDSPSISSGHLVLLDAMRHGKPVIATRGECTADIVDETCALLVEPHSVKDMACAIEEMASDCERRARLADNGRLRYESEFTVLKYGERIAESLIGARSAERTT
jgi:glycosyltransferase involved in cell wall biosynthesis